MLFLLLCVADAVAVLRKKLFAKHAVNLHHRM